MAKDERCTTCDKLSLFCWVCQVWFCLYHPADGADHEKCKPVGFRNLG